MATNKIAWVTGGRGGIGSAVMTAFENANYHTLPVGKSSENAWVIDLSHSRNIETLARKLRVADYPDIIVTCHAAPGMARDEDIVNLDLIGTMGITSYFTKKMIKNKWGRIINLTSYHSQATYPHREGYAAAKAGVAGYSRSLALSLAEHNITVNCVAPGVTETPRTRKFIKEGLVDEDRLLARTPLRRFAQPAEIADLVAFLASDKAEFITGQEIVIDGGYGISNNPGDY